MDKITPNFSFQIDLKDKKTELIEVFNLAFADYFIKIELNENNFNEKVLVENIILEKSIGAFLDNNLVGFILVSIDENKSYNAGTGVLPNCRGNDLTKKMYEVLLPKLQAENIILQQLEVITENIPAIKTYEKIGFKKTKTLACFKGSIKNLKINNDVELKILDEIDETRFSDFWNAQPSWQNSFLAIKRTKSLHKIVGAFLKEKLVGYIIYTASGRIKQFAVDKNFRCLGIGQTLFSQLNNQEIIITNIDENDQESLSFLSKIGLKIFIEQFEMELKI
jgi:ribosomal protein S18 acetylase RimI-like enzyme